MNTEKKYILAIDLGTSGPKVTLISTDFELHFDAKFRVNLSWSQKLKSHQV